MQIHFRVQFCTRELNLHPINEALDFQGAYIVCSNVAHSFGLQIGFLHFYCL